MSKLFKRRVRITENKGVNMSLFLQPPFIILLFVLVLTLFGVSHG